ncbi:MAG: tetratricopeptide repeat protein [Aestuariivirga sp.]
MKLKLWAGASALTCCLLVQPVVAGQFADADAAFRRGDYETEFNLFKPLAEQGDVVAQFSVGWLYEHGRGTSQNYAEAAKWYQLAANQNDILAQLRLARLYYEGNGVPQDYVLSHMWFNVAAAQGNIWSESERDRIAKLMTPNQIAEAQRLARAWVAVHPKP